LAAHSGPMVGEGDGVRFRDKRNRIEERRKGKKKERKTKD